MCKKTLFLFLSLTTHLVFAQYTSIPDPAFETFLEDNGMGDGIPNNGLVLTANIETVTHLDLPSFAGISNMTGIQDFTAVEFLDFSYNMVNNIDLSQNLNLSILGCAYNNITSLDLSNNTNLTWLVCQVNSISDIQLNSPVLHTLECYENQLISLDLSHCPVLETIDCHTNHINNLNISECADLLHLSAWDNQLTEIDISQNINLSSLHLSYNYNLSSLDTSENTLLTQLGCIHTSITSLDLVNNTNLTHVTCFANPITYLDIRNGNNENITTFNATNTDIECIFVDDANATYLENWLIDTTTTFVNNEQECEELHISSIEENNAITIYPNPASEYIIISLNHDATYELFETNGKRINCGNFYNGMNSIDVSDLTKGIYILKFKFEKGTLIKKIIKN